MFKAVLVGCGGISQSWLKACQARDDVAIAGLVDLNEAAARKRVAQYGLEQARVGTDLKATLDTVKPELVFDCTLPETHADVTRLALAQGCHVLGEKPLAENMARARAVVAAAQAAGRIYAVMQNRRFDPQIQALRAFIAAGGIGRVTTVQSDFFLGPHFGGFRETMAHVLLLDMAIHTFDAARYLTGSDAQAVQAAEWNPPGSWFARDASAVAFFEMRDGIRYLYHGSWCAQGCPTTWEAAWRIVGDQGTVTWDGARGFRAEVVTGGDGFQRAVEARTVPLEPFLGRPMGHAGCLDDFLTALKTGRRPLTDAADNIRSLAMVHAAIESAETRRLVPITD